MGVPLIVNTPPEKLPLTPAGKPVTLAPVAPPPIAYVIFVIGVCLHTVCASVPTAELNDIVGTTSTVILPVLLTCGTQEPPEVVTV